MLFCFDSKTVSESVHVRMANDLYTQLQYIYLASVFYFIFIHYTNKVVGATFKGVEGGRCERVWNCGKCERKHLIEKTSGKKC